MSCCDGVIKYLLFFFNLMFTLSGLALIIAGSVVLYQSSGFKEIVENLKSGILGPPIFLIVLGVIVFIAAFLGCCGAIRDNRCLLITFATFLLTIFIIELAVGIFAAVFFQDITDGIKTGMTKYFDSMFGSKDKEDAFHDMESWLQCCGVIGPVDYLSKGQPVPQSCCRDGRCLSVPPYWILGCSDAVLDLNATAGKVIAGLGIAFAIMEILGAVFALRLAHIIRRDRVY